MAIIMIFALIGCTDTIRVSPVEALRRPRNSIVGIEVARRIAGLRLENGGEVLFDSSGGRYDPVNHRFVGTSPESLTVMEAAKTVAFVEIVGADTSIVGTIVAIDAFTKQATQWTRDKATGYSIVRPGVISFAKGHGTIDTGAQICSGITSDGRTIGVPLRHVGMVRIQQLPEGMAARMVGVRGGFTSSNLGGNFNSPLNVSTDYRRNYEVGCLLSQRFSPAFSVQGEAALVGRSAGIQRNGVVDGNQIRVLDWISLSYIEVRILPRLTYASRSRIAPSLFAGPYVAIAMGAHSTFDSSLAGAGFRVGQTGVFSLGNINRYETGIVVGGEVSSNIAGLNLLLDARYRLGLTPMFSDAEPISENERVLVDAAGKGLRVHNSSVVLTCGVRVPL